MEAMEEDMVWCMTWACGGMDGSTWIV